MRFSGKFFGALTATPVAAFAAYEKAQSSFKPNPPAPEFDQVLGSILSGADGVASGSAALAAVTAGYAIYQMFKPDPATKQDVKADGRKTREGQEHLSKQVAAEGRASDAGHGLTHKLVTGDLDERVVTALDADLMTEEQVARIYAKLAEKLGAEGAQRATENIVEAAGRSSDEVQDLLADGKFVEAGVAQQRLAEAGDARQAQLWRDTARIKVLTSIKEAITAYARAVDLDLTDFWTRIELSRLQRAAGSLPDARGTAEAALQHVEDDHDRMVAEGELGDIAVIEGQLPTAARHYQAAMQASRALSEADPDNLDLQRQLSVAHVKLGNVARAKGDLAGARSRYAASLAILERLALADPGNAKWARDLAVSHGELGILEFETGNLIAARKEFGAILTIFKRLAASDPGNAKSARDLSVSHSKLGDVAVAEGDLMGARGSYAAGLAIAEWLAAADPDNAEWARDLFISHAKFAQFNKASGDVTGAMAEFEAGEAILVALIARVGDHPSFAHDLAVVRWDIARLRWARRFLAAWRSWREPTHPPARDWPRINLARRREAAKKKEK